VPEHRGSLVNRVLSVLLVGTYVLLELVEGVALLALALRPLPLETARFLLCQLSLQSCVLCLIIVVHAPFGKLHIRVIVGGVRLVFLDQVSIKVEGVGE